MLDLLYMDNDLTILCVTKLYKRSLECVLRMRELARQLECFFVLFLDADEGERLHTYKAQRYSRIISIRSAGYIESVLDQAVAACSTRYILRLDDDECASAVMAKWLADREYRHFDNWSFPRANLWGDDKTFIGNPPLWPDWQTRLSVKEKSGGRVRIHDASPFGIGRVAPVCIEHHQFLIYSETERRAKAARYEQLQPGAGTGHYEVFSVPEVLGDFDLRPLGDGSV